MSTIDTREHQMFPVLSPAQIDTARRFASGPAVHFPPGGTLYAIGDHGAPAWLVLEGSIEVMRRDGLSREAVDHDPRRRAVLRGGEPARRPSLHRGRPCRPGRLHGAAASIPPICAR